MVLETTIFLRIVAYLTVPIEGEACSEINGSRSFSQYDVIVKNETVTLYADVSKVNSHSIFFV